MKKLLIALTLVINLCFANLGYAQPIEESVSTTTSEATTKDITTPSGLTIVTKQGMFKPYSGGSLDSTTMFEILKTRKIEKASKWNILWEGWSIDVGFKNQSDILETTYIALGRKLGTIGDYLPIDFPLLDKFTITLYPIGMRAKNIVEDHTETDSCYGFAFFELKF